MILSLIIITALALLIYLNASTDTILKILAILVSVFLLTVSYLNYKDTNFNNRFNQLLEQHNKLHSKLEEYIKNNPNEYSDIVNGRMYKNSAQLLYKNSDYSPYLRLLYHVLKFIDRDSIIFSGVNNKKNIHLLLGR